MKKRKLYAKIVKENTIDGKSVLVIDFEKNTGYLKRYFVYGLTMPESLY